MQEKAGRSVVLELQANWSSRNLDNSWDVTITTLPHGTSEPAKRALSQTTVPACRDFRRGRTSVAVRYDEKHGGISSLNRQPRASYGLVLRLS